MEEKMFKKYLKYKHKYHNIGGSKKTDFSFGLCKKFVEFPITNFINYIKRQFSIDKKTIFYHFIEKTGFYMPLGRLTSEHELCDADGCDEYTIGHEFEFSFNQSFVSKLSWKLKNQFMTLTNPNLTEYIEKLYIKKDIIPTKILLNLYSPNYYNDETLRRDLDIFKTFNLDRNLRFFKYKHTTESFGNCIKSLVSLAMPLDISTHEPLGILTEYEIISYKTTDYYHILGIKLTFKLDSKETIITKYRYGNQINTPLQYTPIVEPQCIIDDYAIYYYECKLI